MQAPLRVSHQPAKFDGPRHFSSRDIIVFVPQVILQDHVFKGFSNFMDRSFSG